ncbi:MAG TPA: cytochrome P450 [Mycobacterium sp.]
MSNPTVPDQTQCPVHRIGNIPDLVRTVRSKSVLNNPEYFAAAHKLDDGHVTVEEFVGGMWTFTDGHEHRRRRKMVNSLVRPEALDAMRENYILPAVERLLSEALAEPDVDGRYRCDLVDLADRLFVGFGANMIGLTDMDDLERQAALRQIIPGIFGGVLAQFFDNREAVFQMALAAKQTFVEDFYKPARDAYRAMYAEVEAGTRDESTIPRSLMRLIVSEADPVYADEEVGIRDAILVFNTAIGTSVQSVVHMVHDTAKWFAEHPEDLKLVDDMGFLTRCMEETIRLKAPFISYLVRRAGTDVEIGGTQIAEGDELHIEIPRANRDPEVFGADAGSFNPWRERAGDLPRYGIGFGSGPHACLGLRVVLGNDGHSGSHVRFMQKLFSHGIEPDPDAEPRILAMSQDESAIEDVVTFMSYPVIFTAWKGTAA